VPGIGWIDLVGERFYYVALNSRAGALLCRMALVDRAAFVLVRENEVLAGRSASARHCMIAFVALRSPAAGSLYAHYAARQSGSLQFSYITIADMVILGGKGTLIGPVLGAVIFTFLPELLREASHWRMIIFAAILIVATLFMPRGIVFPLVEHLVPERWRTRHAGTA
jgi:branched-chain amino acid transport system permease protein